MVKNCVGTLSSVQIGESKFDYLASSEVVCTHVVDPGVCFSERCVLAHLSDRRRGNFLLSISYFAFKLLEFLL